MRRKYLLLILAAAALNASSCGQPTEKGPPAPPPVEAVTKVTVTRLSATVGSLNFIIKPASMDVDFNAASAYARKFLTRCAKEEGVLLQDGGPDAQEAARRIVICANKMVKNPPPLTPAEKEVGAEEVPKFTIVSD